MVIRLTDAERVWLRLKKRAEGLAADGDPPTMQAALAIVDQIIREEDARSTPLEARAYFAEELRTMTHRTLNYPLEGQA